MRCSANPRARFVSTIARSACACVLRIPCGSIRDCSAAFRSFRRRRKRRCRSPRSRRFTPADTRSELLRENQQQLIRATADLSGARLGSVIADVKAVLAENPPPPGIRVELGGQYAGQQEAFRALLLVLGLAAASVVAVMVIQFQSFVEPLVVLLAAPLSFVGAIGLLLVTGTPLNVSSFMGLILLVGLIVKNGIILLDFTRHVMRYEGRPLGDGAAAGGAHSSAADSHDDAVHVVRSAAAGARNRRGERHAEAAGARGDRRSRVVDADHAVRRADAARRDSRPELSACRGRGVTCSQSWLRWAFELLVRVS